MSPNGIGAVRYIARIRALRPSPLVARATLDLTLCSSPMAQCAVCSSTVRRARSGPTICGARACQLAALGSDLRAGARARRRDVESAATDLAAQVNAERATNGHAPLSHALLPSNDRVLGPLPAAARRRFLTSLADKIERTAHEPSEGAHDVTPDSGADPLLNAACATCRGYCCIGGGEHAHLDVPSLARIRTERGFTSDDAMTQAYASHLPRVHYRGSCVYHAVNGCALPRDMRADICNRHLCASLTQLTRTIAAGATPPILAIAASSMAPRRTAVISATEIVPVTSGRRSLP